ncbi:MAG: ABC transporter ATP-binding protein [bacterium]|nr:ABC transporter ATP-binding protein [bacterium]MDD5354822.1 ABC transporter ATP-binding protein [bacterium]MDD5756696.1 ABC transporter ATP-binding protein [bacterium]
MSPLIEIKDLSYTYPDGNLALENVSLDVEEGDCVGLIGPNGAGKSTLLLHMNGILHGNNQILIDGLEITADTIRQIREKVALVFQDPEHQLFMPSVYEDIAFGPVNMGWSKDKVNWQVDLALQEVDMLSAKHRSSHHLSFGEKKRISLATVLSMKPKILVLDEPSSNLDPKHRWELIDLLKNLNITKLIATHDLEMVGTLCNKVAILNRGRLKAFGPTFEILSNKDLLISYDLAKA